MKKLVSHALLILASLISIYPVLWVLKMAFSSGRSFASSASPIPTTLSLDNFARVVSTTAPDGSWLFGRQLFNSIVVSGATTVIGIALATTAAYAFSRFRFAGRLFRHDVACADVIQQRFARVLDHVEDQLERLGVAIVWIGNVERRLPVRELHQ